MTNTLVALRSSNCIMTNMDATKIAHIGIRGPRNHQQEYRNAQKYGATVIPCREIKEEGWKAAIQKALAVVSKDTEVIYITICADSLDAAYMPQGPQDMGGLTSYELLSMVHEAALAGACSLRNLSGKRHSADSISRWLLAGAVLP